MITNRETKIVKSLLDLIEPEDDINNKSDNVFYPILPVEHIKFTVHISEEFNHEYEQISKNQQTN